MAVEWGAGRGGASGVYKGTQSAAAFGGDARHPKH